MYRWRLSSPAQILDKFLQVRHSRERVCALEALGRLGARSAIPRMMTRLSDPDHRVQSAAAHQMFLGGCGMLGIGLLLGETRTFHVQELTPASRAGRRHLL